MMSPLYRNVAFIGVILFLVPARTSAATNMKVFTKNNPSDGKLVGSWKWNIPREYDGSRLTIFIVHGFTDGENSGWMGTMKNAFLRKGDFNVIFVTWDAGSSLLDYFVTVVKLYDVGAEIAKVAYNLITNGKSHRSRLYCVGHSLGAHVCGHAGMRTKFGRITGLDPAGPIIQRLPRSLILNSYAADLVDVIHTDGDGLGTMRLLGHVDFFPNGGKLQPGCRFSYLRGEFSCSHSRVVDLYTVSITNPCFKSYNRCPSLESLCPRSSTVHQSMGFDANSYRTRGIFLLWTTSRDPYCV